MRHRTRNIAWYHRQVPASLKKFDDWYFDFYPYLFRHIPFEAMRGRSVLEVGLGYGTVSQRLCEVGARYRGLDIAEGPVEMVNYRLRALGLLGRAQIGNILHAPFADESFDFIVAIGCYHHTGNIRRAIAESWRILGRGYVGRDGLQRFFVSALDRGAMDDGSFFDQGFPWFRQRACRG